MTVRVSEDLKAFCRLISPGVNDAPSLKRVRLFFFDCLVQTSLSLE